MTDTADRPRKPLVLIVDDVSDIRELIAGGVRLYKPNFSVVFAESADQALKILAEQEVSAVVMDVNLVGETGAALAAVIHESYPGLPKVFLTAYDRSVTHQNAEEMGMEVWSKPMEMPKLMGCINRLLARKPSACNMDGKGSKTEVPVSMPEVLRRVTSMIFMLTTGLAFTGLAYRLFF